MLRSPMSTTKPPTSTAPSQIPPVAELPVTRAMLLGVRDELRARIDGTNARIDGTNARIDETNARIDALRAEVLAEIHRIGALVEHQEARNRVVVEAVQGHHARFERIEARIDETQGMIREILDAVRQRPRG